MNLNGTQVIAIISAVLGVLVGSATQLTDLFDPGTAKAIVSIASLANSLVSAVLVVLTGQSAQVKGVLAMPGVENLGVNAKANKALAAIAVDPNQTKINLVPGDAPAINAIAKGA